MNKPDLLLKALDDLNLELKKENSFIELTIVGSMALYLNGLNFTRMTEDIDYINYEATELFKHITEKIAIKYKLPIDWINSRADEISPLPKNLSSQLKTDNRYSNINLSYIDTETAVIMKVYAYYMRELEKDLSDLKLLSPTAEQLIKGIDYINEQIRYHHGDKQLKQDTEDIQSYEEFLKNELI
jgi:hypothetical protein